MAKPTTEATVQLAADTAANKNIIRMVQVLPVSAIPEYIANGQLPMQEMVGLVDSSGNLIGVLNDSLSTADETTQILLQAMIVRLDLLLSQYDSHYMPPDNLGIGQGD